MIMVALSEKYRLVPHVRSHFGSGAPAEAGPPPPPLAEGAVAAPGPTELRRREAGGGTRVALGRVPSG